MKNKKRSSSYSGAKCTGKVVLIRPSYSNLYSVYQNGDIPKRRDIIPPLGLMYLSSVIKREGFDVEIIDGEVTLESTSQISKKAANADFVGITATTPNYNIAINILKKIKERNPKTKTIIGGPHPTAVPHEAAKEKAVDFVIIGEGELSIQDIIKRKAKKKILNVKQVEDLESLPMADHDIIDYNNYLFSEPEKGFKQMASVISSRGCPFQCSFCYHQFKGIRFRSQKKFVDEIEYLNKKKGIEFFFIQDDTFTLNKKRTISICKEILRRGIKANFHCGTRANCIDDELVKVMKKAGFVKTTLGVESGNERMLREVIGKAVTKDDYRRAFRILHKNGIETRGSFILGLPYETKETAEDTIKFSQELDLFRASFNIMTPYPETKIYKMAKKGHGIHFVNTQWGNFRRWGNAVTRTDEISAEDLKELQKEALMRFYTTPKVIKHHIKQLLSGNFSYYYYRPPLFALGRRIKRSFSVKSILRKIQTAR